MRRLVIDDLRVLTFEDGEVEHARTPDYGLRLLLEDGPWDEVYLDHDMGYHPATLTLQDIKPVVKKLEELAFNGEAPPIGKVLIITGNPTAARWMERGLTDYNVEIVPFINCGWLEHNASLDEMMDEWAALQLSDEGI